MWGEKMIYTLRKRYTHKTSNYKGISLINHDQIIFTKIICKTLPNNIYEKCRYTVVEANRNCLEDMFTLTYNHIRFANRKLYGIFIELVIEQRAVSEYWKAIQ